MIMRHWCGRAATDQRDAYPAHFRAAILPQLQRIAGFRGASLLGAESASGIEFLVLTRWDPMGAIRTFAGEDIGHAVVEPATVAALVDFDRRVRHYDVIEEA
jgi:hypothetical protein